MLVAIYGVERIGPYADDPAAGEECFERLREQVTAVVTINEAASQRDSTGPARTR